MMAWGRRLWTGSVLLLTAGCGDSSGMPSLVQTRDSAGVHIVQTREPVWQAGEGLEVSPEPILSIGASAEGEGEEFYQVLDAARLRDDRLVVLNSGVAEVRIYSPEGRRLVTVGTRGEGPGEFQRPEWVELVHDTLMIFDGFQGGGRLSLFGLEGGFIRSERVEVIDHPFASPGMVLQNGRYLDEFSEGSIGADEEGHVVFTRHVVSYARTSSAVDTLISGVAGGERYRERFMNGVSQSAVPFGREGRTAFGGGRVYLSNGDRLIIEAYSLEGAHLMSIRADVDQPEVSEGDIARWIEATLNRPVYLQRPDAAERARGRFEKAPVPKRMPAHDEMMVDADERLWVRQYDPPWEEANAWWVFDAEGAWLGSVDLPLNLQVFEIGEDYLLGVWMDEFDVEYVQVYRLRKLGGGDDYVIYRRKDDLDRTTVVVQRLTIG